MGSRVTYTNTYWLRKSVWTSAVGSLASAVYFMYLEIEIKHIAYNLFNVARSTHVRTETKMSYKAKLVLPICVANSAAHCSDSWSMIFPPFRDRQNYAELITL